MNASEQAWMDKQERDFERWERAHEEERFEEAYQSWASDRRDDGEDDSREAYVDWIDASLPDYA